MNDLLEIKESLIKHLHLENSRANLNFDECFACAYRPDGKDTCDNLIPLLDGALSMIKKLEDMRKWRQHQSWFLCNVK